MDYIPLCLPQLDVSALVSEYMQTGPKTVISEESSLTKSPQKRLNTKLAPS